MSVKKRLFWSHILMFALPLLAYLLCSLLADRLSWMWLLQQRFTSMQDFQRQVQRTELFSRAFTLVGLVGTLLAAYLVSLGSYTLLSPLALEVFLLLWTLPVLLLADWTGRY